jgi:hypothetical protein
MVDLRNGAAVTRSPATTPMPPAESFSTVKQLAIDQFGVIAWIGKRSAIGDPDTIYELQSTRAGSAARLRAAPSRSRS